MSDKETPLNKLNAAIKASWEKNGGNPANYEARRLHEQGFLDGMQYALQSKADNPNILPDILDPNFRKEYLFRLFELFILADCDKQTLRSEFDKAIEKLKERVKNGEFNDMIDYDSKRID